MTGLSDTDIANFALDLLTEPAVADITADLAELSGIERTVARLYPTARDLALKKHWWKPARATASLPTIAETDDRYGNVYQLPSDCVLIWTFNGREDGFDRRFGQGAGKLAAVDAPPGVLVYGRRLLAGETPIELALLIGAELAHLAATTAGVELRAERRDKILAARDEREETALLICGAEGGEEQHFRSRYVDALYGYDRYRPIWDR